jgi:hypothetical protein
LDRVDGHANNFSPKYLFWKVPVSAKGANCDGTNFTEAYDVMQNYGIATLNTVPYTDLGDCSSSTSSSWDSEAADHKIQSYREITVSGDPEKFKTTIKGYLAQKRAVVFGARLGDEFMNCNSDAVLSSQTYGYTGPNANHAMILCGYDDNKGPNGAFRIQNSWNTTWGDHGYIWVDQNYFVSSDFCFCAFVADNLTNPDPNNNTVVDNTTGTDLVAWELNDIPGPNFATNNLNRNAIYNVFNSGNSNIPASKDWNILYLFYNAYDANDYGIILYDYYSNDYGSPGQDGDLSLQSGTFPGLSGNWWNYIDVPSGSSVAHALYNGDASTDRFSFKYDMPTTNGLGGALTGDYYLVLIADGYNVIDEVNEDNNYFFLVDANGDPYHFVNGVIQNGPVKSISKSVMIPKMYAKSPCETARVPGHLNAYTPKEIQKMIGIKKANGDIDRAVQKFLKSGGNKGKKSRY